MAGRGVRAARRRRPVGAGKGALAAGFLPAAGLGAPALGAGLDAGLAAPLGAGAAACQNRRPIHHWLALPQRNNGCKHVRCQVTVSAILEVTHKKRPPSWQQQGNARALNTVPFTTWVNACCRSVIALNTVDQLLGHRLAPHVSLPAGGGLWRKVQGPLRRAWRQA